MPPPIQYHSPRLASASPKGNLSAPTTRGPWLPQDKLPCLISTIVIFRDLLVRENDLRTDRRTQKGALSCRLSSVTTTPRMERQAIGFRSSRMTSAESTSRCFDQCRLDLDMRLLPRYDTRQATRQSPRYQPVIRLVERFNYRREHDTEGKQITW